MSLAHVTLEWWIDYNNSLLLRTTLSSSVWCWSSSAEVWFQRHPEAARATNTQTWRQEFFGSRSSTVERSSTWTAAAGTFLWIFQTIFENTSLWRLKCLVTLSTYRRYVSIYLSNTWQFWWLMCYSHRCVIFLVWSLSSSSTAVKKPRFVFHR